MLLMIWNEGPLPVVDKFEVSELKSENSCYKRSLLSEDSVNLLPAEFLSTKI